MPTPGKRRALGQHFLTDGNIAALISETIVKEALSRDCKAILEIGPGKGALTEPVINVLSAKRGKIDQLILVERDRELAKPWKERQSRFPFLDVHEGDFLALPEDTWLTASPLAVVSNLPYSAATAILTKLAHHHDHIGVMVLMFQKEVAKRLRTKPGTKECGSLSLWIQNRWDVRKLVEVSRDAFFPPPEVTSEVVVLTPRPRPMTEIPDTAQAEKLWEGLLRACFAHRRKMLRSGLSGAPEIFRKALELSGVDARKRAEDLTWEEWRKVWESVCLVVSEPIR